MDLASLFIFEIILFSKGINKNFHTFTLSQFTLPMPGYLRRDV